MLTAWLKSYMNGDDVEPDIQGLQFVLTSQHLLLPILRKHIGGMSILHKAIWLNHHTIIRLLLEKLTLEDIITLMTMIKDNYGSYTPIHYTALYNRHEILRDILRRFRAEEQSPLTLLLTPGRKSFSAAHLAAERDHWEVLECMMTSLDTLEEKFQLIISTGQFKCTAFQKSVGSNSLQTVHVIKRHLSCCQLYKAMEFKDHFHETALHKAAYNGGAEILRLLMDVLTHRQRLQLLKITDKSGKTPRDLAIRQSNAETAVLLSRVRTIALIEIFKSANDEETEWALRFEEPLNSLQILELYPYSQQYMIPRNQEKMKQHALILYREEGREDGASLEAGGFSEALEQAGCDVTLENWSTVAQLQVSIEGLTSRYGTSSLVIVCVMSHGSEGCIEGIDGEVSINSLLQLITPAALQFHIPLVMMIQACQVPPDRYSLGHNSLMDPATVAHGAQAEMMQRHTITSEERKVDLRREHTMLIQTSLPGQVSYRGEYLQEMGNQIRQADGTLTMNDMHERAVYEMERRYGPGGTPKVTSTLMRSLVLPGVQ